jgi:hypothetical protein
MGDAPGRLALVHRQQQEIGHPLSCEPTGSARAIGHGILLQDRAGSFGRSTEFEHNSEEPLTKLGLHQEPEYSAHLFPEI